MDAVTKTIARATFKKSMMDYSKPSLYTLRYELKSAVMFALRCHEQAAKDYREYRLEKITAYLEKRQIRKEIAAFALSAEHVAAQKYIGCYISPFGDNDGHKVSGNIAFIRTMLLEVVAVEVRYAQYGHKFGPYSVYSCKVKSHPAKSFGGNHYRKNELVGTIYTFDHVDAEVK